MWKRPENEPSPSSGPATSSPTDTGTYPAASSPRPPATRGDVASIGASITVKGDISGEQDLLVQGRVEGTIDLKTNHVTVGEHGRVKADIRGRVIDVQGEVEGNLFGDEQVVVRKSGAVRGNITAPRVSLEDGANFKGTIDMEPKPRAKETAPVAGRALDRGASASSGGGSSASGPSASGSSGNGKSGADREPETAKTGSQTSLPTGAGSRAGSGSARG